MPSSDPAAPKQTPLYTLHRDLGAKMVPYSGYAMPVQYPSGILKEHGHTRRAAGLFDVSHMGQLRLSGTGVAEGLEALVPMDVAGLGPGRQRYALFTSESGGILDDLMITNAGDHFFVVVNATCKDADLAHLERHLGSGCSVESLQDRALLALQGPAAGTVMARFAPAAVELRFMAAGRFAVDGVPCFVSRSGYTGEDGFEISLPAGEAEGLARRLLEHPEVAPIGLGARDSLRLEAGLCLHGHDIDEGTTPVEAGLAWALSRARRRGGARAGGFPGADIVLEQLAAGTARRRVGLRPLGRAPVREGCELVVDGGRAVGRVTSGGFGPTVGGPVAMGYVEAALATPGARVSAMVRGKPQHCEVVKLPFVEQRYYRG